MVRRFYGKAWRLPEYRIRKPIDGTEELRIGKEYERLVAIKLSSWGLKITDISMSIYQDDNGEDRYYPFDILAQSPNYSFAADVKYRRSKVAVQLSKANIEHQASFDLGVDVDDRIIIFCTPGLTDSYISLSQLVPITESTCVGGLYLTRSEYGYYIIERQAANKLTIIRKTLETIYYV